MTEKIFRSTLLVAAVALLCSLTIILGVLYHYFTQVQIRQLQDELRITAVGTQLQGIDFLRALDVSDYRLTCIAADGTVLFDTDAEASAMENHGDREEILEALVQGTGSSSRHSDTLLERTVYEAVCLEDGSVLRISRNEQTMLILVIGMLHPFFVVAALVIILAALLAARMSQKIVRPLNGLDLEHPLENDVYEELAPLMRRIHRQNLQIEGQIQTLRQKADEFHQITNAMQEGLVLLNRDAQILSINPVAKKLFELEDNCEGICILKRNCSGEMHRAVNEALDRGHSTVNAAYGGREYRFDLSRIVSDGEVMGAVILAFDITEARIAEQSRKEFTANVSHELKTPLQTIMGSAELLEGGLVQPEDIAHFAGYIRKEAHRLVTLVEDTIRLSQLDEGKTLPREEVDLLALAEEVMKSLRPAARERGVTTVVTGEKYPVFGVRHLLYDIMYNLCENAIKYNVPEGRVTVTVCRQNARTVLTVCDTGIGIPQEHQDRIFERFYRVDKSHSRASGGTGLGLSIVKHAVQYHGAEINLKSSLGKGTEVTIVF